MSKYRIKSSAGMAREAAEEKVETLKGDLQEVEQELREQSQVIARKWEAAATEIEEVQVAPRRTDVQVDEVSVGWAPYWSVRARPGDAFSRDRMVRAFALKKGDPSGTY